MLLVGALAFGTCASARGLSASASVETTTYADPAGDSQNGPDITTVTVEGDPTRRIIEVTVSIPGWQADEARGLDVEHEAWVWLDVDRDRATGDPEDGTDYALAAWTDPTGSWWTVERWNGSAWLPVTRSAAMSFVRRDESLSWTTSMSDLGGTDAFALYVVAGIWSWARADWETEDRAPDAGRWQYVPTEAARAEVELVLSPPVTTPARAVSARRFTVMFPLEFRTDAPAVWVDPLSGARTTFVTPTWTPVSRGRMVCNPSISGKVLSHDESLGHGRVRVSFVVPHAAKGKLLRVAVRITATEKTSGKSLTAKRIAVFRVR